MRLRNGLRVVRRGPAEVQLGTDHRWAVRVDGLSADEASALARLADGASPGALAADDRLDAQRLASLVTQLDEAGILERRAVRSLAGPPGADARVLGLVRPDGDGAATVAARSGRGVGVVGLGPTGLAVALQLALAGVGRITLEDARPVRSSDVGPHGYGWSDVGHPRLDAATRVLAAASPTTTTSAASDVDVLVVVSDDVVDPALPARLVNRGVAHLSVVLREADTVVGPFVVPGAGPCLRCLDLHRTDADPAWPVMATTLAAAARRGSAPPPEPVAVVSVAAGLAVAAILTHLDATSGDVARGGSPDDRPTDGRVGTVASAGAGPCTPRLRGVTLELGLPDAVPRERRWAAHPACGCTAHLSADPASTGRRLMPPGSCADVPDRASSPPRSRR